MVKALPTTLSPKRTSYHTHAPRYSPAAFAWWLFELLGLEPHDELVDLFPVGAADAPDRHPYTRTLLDAVPVAVGGAS